MVYDLIIIGGGPAAAAAGIYASRQGLNVLLIAKGFGGQVARKAVDIENYPGFEKISGQDLFQNFEKHLRAQKIEIKMDEVIKVEKTGNVFSVETEEKNKFESKTIIVASGADPRPLEVPGEKEFIGKGVSYCTVCDGPLFKDKTVAVIGGGNSGLEAAIFLAKIAKKIYILEQGATIKADNLNQEAVKKIAAQIITGAKLKEIRGGKFVESIIYEDSETKKESVLEVQGVFVEIGSSPATAFVKDLVDFSAKDEIMVDLETCQTKTPGLFASGDITNVKDKQIVIAGGQGATAALSAYRYLRNNS